ncbi:MAG TPA: hypothetical protein GX509_00825 [Firmicutes bacterium]|nr:hypothetical protein [Bacillota bacterium]
MRGSGGAKSYLWIVILLGSIVAGVAGFFYWQEKGPKEAPVVQEPGSAEIEAVAIPRDIRELFIVAAGNTLGIKKAKITEEVSFPTSSELVGMDEARKLGTGLWERIIEFTPAALHYVSSTEDSEFEGYRAGDRIVFRVRDAGSDSPGPWQKPDSAVQDEELASEVEWISKFNGMGSVLESGFKEATEVKTIKEDSLGGQRCMVVSFRPPSVDERFYGSGTLDKTQIQPVKYEMIAWITKGSKPVILQIEDMYVYKSKESGLYEYSVGKTRIQEVPNLGISMPAL